MKNIVVLGNSLTAVEALAALKLYGVDFAAVFISLENTFPYHHNLLSSLPLKKVPQSKIFYRTSAEYESEGITFIFDKKVTRVNLKRGRLTLDDKENIDYDVLFLADLFQAPFAGVKGANKTGLFNLKRLSDMTTFLKLSPLIETIVIESNNLAGLKTAVALCETKKEVILVTMGKHILDGILTQTDAVAIEALLKDIGLRIIVNDQITEFLGDAEVKAIRLKSGKVLGCQAVLTDSDLPDLRLFKETQLQYSQRVLVNKHHQTNFENVFAMDAVCDTIKPSDWDISQNYFSLAQLQGKIIAAKIAGQEFSASEQALIWELELKGQVIKLLSCAAAAAVLNAPVLQVVREEAAVLS